MPRITDEDKETIAILHAAYPDGPPVARVKVVREMIAKIKETLSYVMDDPIRHTLNDCLAEYEAELATLVIEGGKQ